MDALSAILLGIIQGITEFLPVSSDGHLTVAEYFLGLTEGSLAYNVTLHIGTLLAVILYFFKNILRFVQWRFIKLALITSLPTAVIGLAIQKTFDFDHPNIKVVGGFLWLTGTLLYFSTRKMRAQDLIHVSPETVYAEITPLKAFLIGIAQGIAVLPGVSRSGSTIATAVLLNCRGSVATFYSFVVSIPAIAGACLLELPKAEFTSEELPNIMMGTGVSFVVGLLSLWVLDQYFVKKAKLAIFSYYLWVLSAVLILFYR